MSSWIFRTVYSYLRLMSVQAFVYFPALIASWFASEVSAIIARIIRK
jgi:hypothetical protein